MAANSVNDRNDADLAIGYRAALRRAAAAAREAALLEDLLMARGASAIAGDETVEVEVMIVGRDVAASNCTRRRSRPRLK